MDPLADEERLLVGNEDRMMSWKSDWNSGVPIVGVDEDVAPDGAQSVKPEAQLSSFA